MGRYLEPGHTYTDGQTVTGPSLTEHVSEATFKTTSITEQTLKTPAALTDQLLVVSSGAFFQETIQQIHDLILYSGCVVQTAYVEYTANTNLTTVIPADDTIPQNTEGTEILSLSITPRFATSLIEISFSGPFSLSNATNAGVAALFRDSTVNAIDATMEHVDVANYRRHLALFKQDSPATTSAITYKVRVGPIVPGTMRMNGSAVARDFGGASVATLSLKEIKQ